jgi:hypothetical protein
MNETLSRFLLALEALTLLLPLSALYGLLFAIAFTGNAWNLSSGNLSFGIATLLAGAGLVALWRLLVTGMLFGIAALRAVPRGWTLFCTLIGGWVVTAWSLMALAALGGSPLSLSPFAGVFLGVYGTPALVPLLHLAAELHWREGDLT